MAKVQVPVHFLSDRLIDADVYQWVEKLMALRKKKKLWEALDEIVRFYKKNYAGEYNESIAISRDLRKSRGDEWGRGAKLLHKESRRANLRMVMNLPYRLVIIIRKVYDTQELPFDRKFLRKFGRKYPEFLVPEKGYKTISN